MATAVAFLNTHSVKEGIKNTLGLVTFAGCSYALYQTTSTKKTYPSIPSWQKNADKTIIIFLKISVVLSCVVSRPGLMICGWVIHLLISRKTLADIFGLNTIFEFNPWHPRHIVTIGANILSASALIKWVFDRYVYEHQPVGFLIAVGAFNFFTGRSTLHLVNAACRHFFRK
jgi:hypothetical protein